MEKEKLINEAKEAAKQSYSPYSHFPVGAALLLKDGTVIRGANIENRSFGLTNCAERSAIYTALSQGRKDFAALAIFCPESETAVPPCGACRQVISEFTNEDFPIYYQGSKSDIVVTNTKEIMPQDSLHNLKDKL